MGDIGNTEGVPVSVKGSENGHGRWGWLRSPGNLFRKPNSNHHEQASQSVGHQQEAALVVRGSGYVRLIEDFQSNSKEGNEFLAQILEEEYDDLISVVNSDKSMKPEVKQALVDGINTGNREVIAVVAARLFANMGGDVKLRSRTLKKDANLKNKLIKIKTLADATEKFFINQESTRNDSQQLPTIKADWAKSKFFQAVSNPNWLPAQQASVPPGVEHAFAKADPNVLNPSAPAK